MLKLGKNIIVLTFECNYVAIEFGQNDIKKTGFPKMK